MSVRGGRVSRWWGAAGATTVAVLLALTSFSLGSAVVNDRATASASASAMVGQGYERLEDHLVELDEASDRTRSTRPAAITDDFQRTLDAAQDQVDELRVLDVEDTEALERADADLRLLGNLAGRLVDVANTEGSAVSDAVEEQQLDPVVERLLEFCSGQSEEHLDLAVNGLDRLDLIQSVLLVATPLAFGLGLLAVLVTNRVLRDARRELEDKGELNRRQARHDALTGLPNRVLLQERADQALQDGDGQVSLLLIDLDRFKDVNDTLGHGYGDIVLTTVAERLLAELRPRDTVARLGGDEFAVLLPTTPPEIAHATALRVRAAIERPVEVDGIVLQVEASVGVSWHPSLEDAEPDDVEVETLLRRADVAMYAAKSSGSGVVRYDAGADPHSPERLGLLGELRRALDDDVLELHYQPKVDLADGRVRGVEALLRWRHPERGDVPPALFVPMAEHTNLIGPLTAWVLRAALAQCLLWQAQGHYLQVAVNVSARNLLAPDFVDVVRDSLRDAGVAPAYLQLELTESAVLVDPERVAETLRALAALGVAVSIDDFGTGATSLSHLPGLTVHEIKIDRSFVGRVAEDARLLAVVRSVVQLGHDLGLTVVAEGVEDEACRARLVALGCDVAQGHLFGPAVPAAELRTGPWRSPGGSAATPVVVRPR